jgi:hypothetical protein
MENGRVVIGSRLYVVSYSQEVDTSRSFSAPAIVLPGRTKITLSNGLEIDASMLSRESLKQMSRRDNKVRTYRLILEEEIDGGESIWQADKPG